MKAIRRAAGVAAVILAAATTAPATTIQVPAEQATVGAALAAAAAGDTIAVAAGTYAPSTNGETFPLALTADIAVIGAGMGLAILDAEGTGTVFTCTTATGGRISGFTITGGVAARGGGISLSAGSPEIDGNLFLANGAELRGAGLFGSNAATPWIHHNVFWENYDTVPVGSQDPHTIVLAGSVGGVFEHNLVGRADGNGLLTSVTAAPSVRHNILFENGIPSPVRGRGICWFSSSAPAVFHNLFWGNQINAILWPDSGGDLSGTEANDLSPTDSIFGNLDDDPLLADPDDFDFSLTSDSPAIDAGEPSFPFDPDGTITDLGPFFFDQGASAAPILAGEPTILSLAGAPNPFTASTSVRFGLERGGEVRVDLLDVRGRLVQALHAGRLPAGSHAFGWSGRDTNGRRVASGVYFARVSVDGQQRTAPLVLLR